MAQDFTFPSLPGPKPVPFARQPSVCHAIINALEFCRAQIASLFVGVELTPMPSGLHRPYVRARALGTLPMEVPWGTVHWQDTACHATASQYGTRLQLEAPLTAQSTVRSSGGAGTSSEPQAVQLEDAVVPPDFKRQKVPFEKGYSQMDWLRLKSKGKDLQGQPLNGSHVRESKTMSVTLEEVRQHRTPEDGWCVVRGVVYNVTPYLRFHPGGADIMKNSLGKDATALFNKYHQWVNVSALLDKCVVGMLEQRRPDK